MSACGTADAVGCGGHRDTPPVDVSVRHGRSPGSRVVAFARLPEVFRLSDMNGFWLAAYSCGGSAGIPSRGTGFPLSPRV